MLGPITPREEYLAMLANIDVAEIAEAAENLDIGDTTIDDPNESPDASEFLNENRKPNPYADAIIVFLAEE